MTLVRTVSRAAAFALMVASGALASRESDLLFRGVKTFLAAPEKEEIAKQAGLVMSKDGRSFVDEAGNKLGVEVRELDLNADKKPEVLVILSGPMFGQAGSAVQLYVKNTPGKYAVNLGFPAADVKALPSRTRGYQDLQILGPGFECPVWKWDGREYQFSHKVKCE